jgi:beta-lactamase class A
MGKYTMRKLVKLMKQMGYADKIVVAALCMIIAGGYFLGYRPTHAKALEHKVIIAEQTVKTDQSSKEQSELTSAWKESLDSDPADGNVDVAVFDNDSDMTADYTNTSTTFNAASIAKLSILEDLLWHNQQQGTSGLTADQMANAQPMIENSDDNAATTLYDQIGEGDELNNIFKQIGTASTSDGPHWGLTQTTAPDQLKVINEIAYPGKLFTAASAKVADNLMNNIESDQRWGVTAGVPTGVTVELKDGWLDYNQGWNVNSVGHVHGDGDDYTIAVLTDNNKSEQDGINTVQQLSAITWNTLNANKKV